MNKNFYSGDARQHIEGMLRESQAFTNLDPHTQHNLTQSLGKIADYLSTGQSSPIAGQLAPPDLRSRLSPSGGNTPQTQQPQQKAPSSSGQPAPSSSGGSSSATGRVGEVTRATLNAINFPDFVAQLIQGTFQAIVDASIQQMEAYAELVKNVALTVDQFMQDNITEGHAQDYLADRFTGVFSRDTSGTTPKLVVNQDNDDQPLPSFFQNMGLETPRDIDDDTLTEVIIPETRRTLAEQRQQTLATMVLMGINRVLVDDGQIMAKLQFHIDASEDQNIKFEQTQTTVGNIAGTAGGNRFMGNGIMVNTASINAQSDINVRADLTGEVRVNFRSEAFPLERFADSSAIQLINNRARVPTTQTDNTSGGNNRTNGGTASTNSGNSSSSTSPSAPAVAEQSSYRALHPLTSYGQETSSEDTYDPNNDAWAPRL